MKLATLKSKHRDGQLVVVSRDLSACVAVPEIAQTLQEALDNWSHVSPLLVGIYNALCQGRLNDGVMVFNETRCAAPLPRAFQWADGSAYLHHVELVRQARGATLPPEFLTSPLMYQGGSDAFVGPHDPILAEDEEYGIDLEAEVAVITDDVPMGTRPSEADQHIRLLMLVNDVSLRNLIPAELAKGFGFFHSKPPTAFSPVAVTPDEVTHYWQGGKLRLPLISRVNDRLLGRPNAGDDMQFSFYDLLAHAAHTRPLSAGSIIGSGTVSNKDPNVGSSCLAEVRTLEVLQSGQASTPFLKFGDRITIEMLDDSGNSIFGAIDQVVKPYVAKSQPAPQAVPAPAPVRNSAEAQVTQLLAQAKKPSFLERWSGGGDYPSTVNTKSQSKRLTPEQEAAIASALAAQPVAKPLVKPAPQPVAQPAPQPAPQPAVQPAPQPPLAAASAVRGQASALLMPDAMVIEEPRTGIRSEWIRPVELPVELPAEAVPAMQAAPQPLAPQPANDNEAAVAAATSRPQLYGYWRSSATYRVRIALNLKGVDYDTRPIHLNRDGGEQYRKDYLAQNPEGRVPLFVEGDFSLSQSLAIFDYLEQRYPDFSLLPADPRSRAKVWAFCHTIACDIQPLQNISVINYLDTQLAVSDADRKAWAKHWIHRGLLALEQGLAKDPTAEAPLFLFGDEPTYADCCLVPQFYNAERFECPVEQYPRLAAVVERLRRLPAFVAAHPDLQPDAA